MIEPQVEQGGASSWFWIVECWFAGDEATDLAEMFLALSPMSAAVALARSPKSLAALLARSTSEGRCLATISLTVSWMPGKGSE